VIVSVRAGGWQPSKQSRFLMPPLMLCNWPRLLHKPGAVPTEAVVDATHIAIATVHGMAYLLTWNCAHIANATMRTRIETICRSEGYEPPVLCTPEELMED